MPSDAEVVEVLARAGCGNQHGSCECADIGDCVWSGAIALAALRSAGYAVVKAGELEALVRAGRAIANDPKVVWHADGERLHALSTALAAPSFKEIGDGE